MKKIIGIILAIMLLATTCWAASLAWDYDDSSNLTGWVFYYQPTNDTSQTYHYVFQDPTKREMPLSNLVMTPGVSYKIWMTAYTTGTESGSSNNVVWDNPAYQPPSDSHPVTITIQAPATVTITQP